MPDDERRTYYIVAKEFPVALCMDDVTYTEAMAVATNCVADGQLLWGPDDGPEGFVLSFDRVAGVRVTSKMPPGSAMVMPAKLVAKLAVEPEDTGFAPDDSKDGDHG